LKALLFPALHKTFQIPPTAVTAVGGIFDFLCKAVLRQEKALVGQNEK